MSELDAETPGDTDDQGAELMGSERSSQEAESGPSSPPLELEQPADPSEHEAPTSLEELETESGRQPKRLRVNGDGSASINEADSGGVAMENGEAKDASDLEASNSAEPVQSGESPASDGTPAAQAASGASPEEASGEVDCAAESADAAEPSAGAGDEATAVKTELAGAAPGAAEAEGAGAAPSGEARKDVAAEWATSGEPEHFALCDTPFESIHVSPDGLRVVGGARGGRIWMGSGPSFGQEDCWRAHGYTAVLAIRFSAGGARLISCGYDGFVRFWDTKTRVELHHFAVASPGSLPFDIDVSRDESIVLSVCINALTVWEARTGRKFAEIPAKDCSCVALAPDGLRAAAGGSTGWLRVWDLASCAELLKLPGHQVSVTSLAFAQNGAVLISGGSDRVVRVWSAGDGALVRTLEVGVPVFRLAASSDGSLVALVTRSDRIVRLWDAAAGRHLRSLSGLQDGETLCTCVALSENGQAIAVGTDLDSSSCGSALVWRRRSPEAAAAARRSALNPAPATPSPAPEGEGDPPLPEPVDLPLQPPSEDLPETWQRLRSSLLEIRLFAVRERQRAEDAERQREIVARRAAEAEATAERERTLRQVTETAANQAVAAAELQRRREVEQLRRRAEEAARKWEEGERRAAVAEAEARRLQAQLRLEEGGAAAAAEHEAAAVEAATAAMRARLEASERRLVEAEAEIAREADRRSAIIAELSRVQARALGREGSPWRLTGRPAQAALERAAAEAAEARRCQQQAMSEAQAMRGELQAAAGAVAEARRESALVRGQVHQLEQRTIEAERLAVGARLSHDEAMRRMAIIISELRAKLDASEALINSLQAQLQASGGSSSSGARP
eukprot:tig00020780_g13780.t1